MKNDLKDIPSGALKFLAWFCPPALYESIEGDLLEAFQNDVEQSGLKKARRRFYLNVVRFFKPYILLRNKVSVSILNTIMITNYFKVASRNILKRKLYSFINAFGLSIGIAFCVLIFLYIEDERSFDKFHANRDQIFRMEEMSFDTWQPKEGEPYSRSAYLQVGLAPVMKEEIKEIQYATRFNPDHSGVFRANDKVFTEKITYVDGDFFRMFSFPLLKGNAEKLFIDKSEVVLTPPIVKKYFGDEDPIGKTIQIDMGKEKSYTVAGVIEEPPANSSLQFNILIPQENRGGYERNLTQWGNFNTPTFVQLYPNSDLNVFSTNLDKLIQKYMADRLERWRKESAILVPADVKMLQYEFTNIADIHLKKQISWNGVSDPQYSLILGGIAILILIIACINYVSLALTTSATRKTEVGIRKVVGAQKNQLISQFSMESVILALLSMLIGLGLVTLFLPFFNEFTGKGIRLTVLNILQLVPICLGITTVVGLLAGSYPAFFLASYRPAQVLKGRTTSRLQSGFTRPLVVLQFALSAFLIISSVIMYRQMEYVTTKDLGYAKEQIIVIPTQTGYNSEADKTVIRFRQRAQQEPVVMDVGGTTTSFNQGYSRYGYKIKGEQKAAFVYGVDPYYIPTLGLTIIQGRNFDERIPSDSTALIVNEALVRDMKWTDPLNEYLNYKEDTVGQGSRIIGVVKDYHFLSLERNIEPMFMSMEKKSMGNLSTILVKIKPGNIPESIEKIHTIWKEVSPDKPFDYTFLDEDVDKQYKVYKRWMSIMGFSTCFAIMISCLGLFGLAGINAVNRTKEIGIRKVMGAELSNIFILLNRQYIWLSLIAFLLAAPLSWYIMNRWLVDFKFKIEIGWELFAVSMVSGLLIALLTVSYHAIKASLVNPAETLKYE